MPWSSPKPTSNPGAAEPPQVSQEQQGILSKLTLLAWVCAVLFLVGTILFLPAAQGIDDIGLFNPIYMQLHYGETIYPIHQEFETMTVHPPVHYVEIASLMKLGVPLQLAQKMLIMGFLIAAAVVIVTSPISATIGSALLFGMVSALLFMPRPYEITTLRPDTHLALAWFVGLLLLEAGRLCRWERKRLFLGAFLLTYASGLHYYGVLAFTGSFVYLLSAYRSLPRPEFLKTGAAIVLGGSLFGVPYLLLFVWPDWSSIVHHASAVQRQGTGLAALGRHFEQYAWWVENAGDRSALYYLIYPALSLKIPVCVIGTVLLCIHRQTRLLAFASLPLCLFILLWARGKSAGYYLPELIIFFAGLGVMVAWLLCSWKSEWWPDVRQGALSLVSITTIFLTLNQWGVLDRVDASALEPPEMEIARAASLNLVGPNALVGGRIGLWYVSGATHWYDIAPDLLWKRDISNISLEDYFANFDYVVEHQHMSYTTLNGAMESLPSWYAAGTLRLSGFYLSQRHPTLSFLVLRGTGARQVRGYFFDSRTLRTFKEKPGGLWRFVSQVCEFESWPVPNKLGLPFFNAILLPKAGKDGDSYHPEAQTGSGQKTVVNTVLPESQFEAIEDELTGGCTGVNVIEGDAEVVDIQVLMREAQSKDTTIKFYKHLGDAVLARRFAGSVATELPLLVQPDPPALLDQSAVQKVHGSISTEEGGRIRIKTSPQQWAYAAVLPIPAQQPEPDNASYLLSITLQVHQGQVGVGLLTPDKSAFVTERFVGKGTKAETVSLFWIPVESSPEVMVRNAVSGGLESEVTLYKAEVRRLPKPMTP